MAAKSKATRRRATKKVVAKRKMKQVKGGITDGTSMTFKGSPTKLTAGSDSG